MSETFCLGKGMKAVRKPARKVSGRDDELGVFRELACPGWFARRRAMAQ